MSHPEIHAEKGYPKKHHLYEGIASNLPFNCVVFQHAVTEVIAFFQVPQVTVEDMKAVAQASWEHMTRISRLGLQYAIELHKVTLYELGVYYHVNCLCHYSM